IWQDRVEHRSSNSNYYTTKPNYSTKATNVYLFWYKQLSIKSPTLILNKYPFSEGITDPDGKKRFSATLDTTSRTVPLMIKNLRVSDSAVYYCALRPTLYKNSNSFFTLISNHIKPTIYNSHNIIILVETPGLVENNINIKSLSLFSFFEQFLLIIYPNTITMSSDI
uniref:Immunoglobulin V-set domain-containing protein n=1 Tax=Sinocyclocheilus rhinocerous TaxID=307959 RepID=A0A673ICW0_9TELE